jgi:hypothetical protein
VSIDPQHHGRGQGRAESPAGSHGNRSRGASWLAVLLAGVLYPACGDSVDSRYARHRAQTTITFGADARLALEVAPGRALAPRLRGLPWRPEVRASAPYVRFALANGEFSEQVVRVQLDNVDPDARYAGTLGPLRPGRRRDSRCLDPALLERPTVFTAPRTADVVSTGARAELEVVLPPCAEWSWSGAPPPATEVVRWVVFGRAGGDADTLVAMLEVAARLEARAMVVLGDVEGAASSFAGVQSVLRAGGRPVVVLPGPRELDDWRAFQDVFGQSDFVARIGSVRLLALDSADGTLGPLQWELVEGQRPEPVPTVLLSWASMANPVGLALAGLDSTFLSQRMVAALRRMDTALAVSGDGSRPWASAWSGLQWEGLASAFRGPERVALVLEVERPVPARPVCQAPRDCPAGSLCEAGICLGRCVAGCAGNEACDDTTGLCRRPCEEEPDPCPRPARCGPQGWCDEATQLRWERIRW